MKAAKLAIEDAGIDKDEIDLSNKYLDKLLWNQRPLSYFMGR
jgi:hypothetical protein